MRNCFIAGRERSVRSVEFVYGHSQAGPQRMLPLTCISFTLDRPVLVRMPLALLRLSGRTQDEGRGKFLGIRFHVEAFNKAP